MVLTSLDEVFGGQSNGLEDVIPVVDDDHDSDAKTSMVSENTSESELSSNDDGPTEDKNPPVAWREPRRGRKIQTTSLLLRRRKKIKQRQKHREPVLKQAYQPLRLRGGGTNSKQNEGKSAEPYNDGDLEIDNRGNKPPPKKILRTRNYVAGHWPDQLTVGSCFEKSCQRPAPMAPPREQDLSFGNMTIDCIDSEDGQEIFSPLLDSYKRTDAQIEAVKEAGADQRKVGGGVYQIKDKSQKFFTIQKGWASKDIGLTLSTIEDGVVRTRLKCFAMMNYEPFQFSKHTPGLRLRQKQPEETHTGFVWYGCGGDLVAGSCRVYTYCERAGERDLHFSEEGCNRLTEAPGASQQMCNNQHCGVVCWHFSQKEFSISNNGEWQERQQNDFALVVFQETGKEELVLTEQPVDGETVRSRWIRLESSAQFDGVHIDPGRRECLINFFQQNPLPPSPFPCPRYAPQVQQWREQAVLRRQAANSER